MVKRLRRRPLTAKSAVRVRLEVPTICQLKSVGFFVGTSLNVLRTFSAPLCADSNRWSRLSSTASHFLPRPRFPSSLKTIRQLKSVGFFVGTSLNVLRTFSAPLCADSNRWSRLSSTASHILPRPRSTSSLTLFAN